MTRLAICPNCTSPEVKIVPAGRLLPFVAKRVLGIEPPTLATFLPHRAGVHFTRLARKFPLLRLEHARPLQCDILICTTCDFVCPALDLGDDQLMRLYHDYRSDSYNADRIRYEPAYRKLADLVGKSPGEHRARIAHVEAFLSGVPGAAEVREVLDFAGADGRFIPPGLLARCHCTVYDVSEEQPFRAGIRKVSQLEGLGTFDYVQLCHLLEHVRSPKTLLQTATRHLAPDGLLYVEVPKEGSKDRIERLRAGAEAFAIHEHINLYTEKSLAALLEAVGLTVIKMEAADLDVGWCRATVLSALAAAQKTASDIDVHRTSTAQPLTLQR